jgi:anaerobic selenocysteine-containing dehydrogenase
MSKDGNLSRRNFLKGSLVGAGALTAGVGAGLFVPGTAQASLPVLPLPYCRNSSNIPSKTPNTSNITVLDPDDVRVRTWWYYNSGKG